MNRDALELLVSHRLTECDECQEPIVKCDNNVWLDVEPVERTDFTWFIVPLGSVILAAAGGPSNGGSSHELHKHQPPEQA